MILTNNGHVHRKEGIGFVSSNTQQKPTTFVKGPTLNISFENKYNFCSKHSHFTYKCSFKRYDLHKLVWVPKGTINDLMSKNKISRSNHEGPKVKWVPKGNLFFL